MFRRTVLQNGRTQPTDVQAVGMENLAAIFRPGLSRSGPVDECRNLLHCTPIAGMLAIYWINRSTGGR